MFVFFGRLDIRPAVGLVGGRLTRTERAPFLGDEGDGLSGTGRGDRFRSFDLSLRDPIRDPRSDTTLSK